MLQKETPLFRFVSTTEIGEAWKYEEKKIKGELELPFAFKSSNS